MLKETTPCDQIDVLVGANLRRLRLERGKTIQGIAAAAEVSYQQVQKYEKGNNRIAASTLYRLARELHINIGDFYDGVEILITEGSYEVVVPDQKEKNMLIEYRKIGKIDQHHVFNVVKSIASHIGAASSQVMGTDSIGSSCISPEDKL